MFESYRIEGAAQLSARQVSQKEESVFETRVIKVIRATTFGQEMMGAT